MKDTKYIINRICKKSSQVDSDITGIKYSIVNTTIYNAEGLKGISCQFGKSGEITIKMIGSSLGRKRAIVLTETSELGDWLINTIDDFIDEVLQEKEDKNVHFKALLNELDKDFDEVRENFKKLEDDYINKRKHIEETWETYKESCGFENYKKACLSVEQNKKE